MRLEATDYVRADLKHVAGSASRINDGLAELRCGPAETVDPASASYAPDPATDNTANYHLTRQHAQR